MNKVLIGAVKDWALRHYEEKYGWSEIIECFSDDDIQREFIDGGYGASPAMTTNEAINRATSYVELKEERYREAVGPDIECPECGTKFGENTACPKCR